MSWKKTPAHSLFSFMSVKWAPSDHHCATWKHVSKFTEQMKTDLCSSFVLWAFHGWHSNNSLMHLTLCPTIYLSVCLSTICLSLYLHNCNMSCVWCCELICLLRCVGLLTGFHSNSTQHGVPALEQWGCGALDRVYRIPPVSGEPLTVISRLNQHSVNRFKDIT